MQRERHEAALITAADAWLAVVTLLDRVSPVPTFGEWEIELGR